MCLINIHHRWWKVKVTKTRHEGCSTYDLRSWLSGHSLGPVHRVSSASSEGGFSEIPADLKKGWEDKGESIVVPSWTQKKVNINLEPPR